MSQPKIRTDCICPPIPIRSFDWIAYIDGREENERGFGETEEAAIADLIETLNNSWDHRKCLR